jgi:hypothetical protein
MFSAGGARHQVLKMIWGHGETLTIGMTHSKYIQFDKLRSFRALNFVIKNSILLLQNDIATDGNAF